MTELSGKDQHNSDTLLISLNREYILALYQLYQQDSAQVGEQWQAYFKKAYSDDHGQGEQPIGQLTDLPIPGASKTIEQAFDLSLDPLLNSSVAAVKLIEAYRQWGHTLAKLDPLNLTPPALLPQLDLKTYSLKETDLVRGGESFKLGLSSPCSVADLKKQLTQIYGQSLGLEFYHLEDYQQRLWLQQQFEHRQVGFSSSQRLDFFKDLLKTELFEHFLHTKFPGSKRFSLQGNDSLVPALNYLLSQSASSYKVQQVLVSMAHRGRLSVMAHVLGKPLPLIFAGFQNFDLNFKGSGDVKYHQGYSASHSMQDQSLEISLLPNASHLESINPIGLGRAHFLKSQAQAVLPIFIHGDAAFMGQGVVFETFQIAQLPGYQVGGSFHILLNNQIGFTANAEETRATRYCSDLAKAMECPIFHVNAEDIESVMWCFETALKYRYQFQKDVVIDLVGYRRYGHNEGDEPRYTQPEMYRAIDKRPPAVELYKNQLEQQGLEVAPLEQSLRNSYGEALQQALNSEEKHLKLLMEVPRPSLVEVLPQKREPIELSDLHTFSLKGFEVPKSIALNPKLNRILLSRKKVIENKGEIDWATAETLAFTALLSQGCPIRLTGQDSKRGTFSQRHAEWIDMNTGSPYTPFKALENFAPFSCINSPLSEAAALSFEYGYSLGLKGLTLWEAQFGDFVNGAQVLIDQYLAAGFSKWDQSSNLTLLLPHGFEGQGPEHSSARLERFLQLSAEENWRIAVCSTPANFYHLLISQAKSTKPLIALTPKSLLRHPEATSAWEDFDADLRFQAVLRDTSPSSIAPERVIFCSGKVYYDLEAYRQRLNLDNVVIIRLEQLYPFPTQELALSLYGENPKAWTWCQEEPENMGAWSFARPLLEALIKSPLILAARPAAASPATGFLKRHIFEQEYLIEQAFTRKP